eukprot:5192981-Pyramimonas_sp.AAC.1
MPTEAACSGANAPEIAFLTTSTAVDFSGMLLWSPVSAFLLLSLTVLRYRNARWAVCVRLSFFITSTACCTHKGEPLAR